MLTAYSPYADRLPFDPQGMRAMKAKAAAGDPESLREAARQFESMIVQTVLKTMRETRFSGEGDPFGDSNSLKLYRELLDQQWAQKLTASGGLGFADAMYKAMARQAANPVPNPHPPAEPRGRPAASAGTEATAAGVADVRPAESRQATPEAMPTGTGGRADMMADGRAGQRQPERFTPYAPTVQPRGEEAAPAAAGMAGQDRVSLSIAPMDPASRREAEAALAARPGRRLAGFKQRFIDRLGGAAERAAAEIGVPARYILGHAALESGWGRREIRDADGHNSHNLFGIKAGRSWKGDVVEHVTTEYRYGVPVKRVERFRAYDSYEAAFRDYASLLKRRYAGALEEGASPAVFAQRLASGGYATDPAYAGKLRRVIGGLVA